MSITRFECFQSLAGTVAGLLLIAGLALTWGDPSSETAPGETFSYWAQNRGQHQISGLLLAPLIAFLLVFFGAGLRRNLRDPDRNRDAGQGSVAFGGAILAAATFALSGCSKAPRRMRRTKATGRPPTRSVSSTPTTGWPGTPPSRQYSSRPASARGGAGNSPPRSCGRQS
jgi:hypothetical protein